MLSKVIASLCFLGILCIGAFFPAQDEAPMSTLESVEQDTTMEIIRESSGEIYEYPSVEDLEIIEDIPQDSVVHYLMFQEKPGGDEYSIK